MRMTYYPLKPFEINEGKLTVIETNNHEFYQTLILNFKDLQDDVHFSDDEFKLVETSKAIHWFGDAFIQNDLDKLFTNRLYKHFKEVVTPEQQQQIFELSQQLKLAVLCASYSLDLPLQIEEQTELEKVFKFCDLRFIPTVVNRPYDIIETLLKTSVELNESRILGLMNVSDYLTRDEFSELNRLIQMLNIKIILIKFSEINRYKMFEGCRYYYVDNDYVEWHYE
jgi:CRISPR type II-A-associated protein Csn2